MIKAKGKRNGKDVTVEYSDGAFTFNGKSNYRLEAEIDLLLDEKRAVGGTYWPKEKMEPLNIIGVMGDRFFDRPVAVEGDEEAELPSEKGVVY